MKGAFAPVGPRSQAGNTANRGKEAPSRPGASANRGIRARAQGFFRIPCDIGLKISFFAPEKGGRILASRKNRIPRSEGTMNFTGSPMPADLVDTSQPEVTLLSASLAVLDLGSRECQTSEANHAPRSSTHKHAALIVHRACVGGDLGNDRHRIPTAQKHAGGSVHRNNLLCWPRIGCPGDSLMCGAVENKPETQTRPNAC